MNKHDLDGGWHPADHRTSHLDFAEVTMRKFLFALCAPLLLAACMVPSLGGLLGNTAAPAPLERTVIDDKALRAAWQTFDTALDAINLAIDACETVNFRPTACLRVKPGTASANSLADAIVKVKTGLQGAEHAAAAGSAKDYGTALAEANAALGDIKLLMKGTNQ